MRTALVLLPLLTIGWTGDAPPERTSAAGPVWQTDYAAARRLARADGRPIFAVLH